MFKKLYRKIWEYFNWYSYSRLELEIYLYRSVGLYNKPDWLIRSETWISDI